MKNALTLGRPFGIKVSVHWTFLLIIAWIVFLNLQQGASTQQIIYSILFIIAIFVCVVIHELSHSLMARRYGIPTRSITLLPIGGLADLQKMPEEPKQEFAVSISGPLSNIAIALVLSLLLLATGNINLSATDFQAITGKNFFIVLMFANLMLAVFNLLPAFPMDGGRVFRSLMAIYFSREKATYVAMNMGKIFAFGLAVLGIFINPFLIFIAIFIFIGAEKEYEQVRYTSVLSGYRVQDILMHEFTSLREDETLRTAVNILLAGPEQRFVVIDHENRVKGILTRNNIIQGLSDQGEELRVRQVMNKNITTFAPETSLEEAFQIMQKQRITMAPVVQNEKLVGIIDMDNINEFIMVRSAVKRP
ncbi:MAG: site-2 protease family protein [Bacteroidota bacterium]